MIQNIAKGRLSKFLKKHWVEDIMDGKKKCKRNNEGIRS